MSFSNENGYSAPSIQTIMAALMDGVNAEFGTTYTAETFIGTNLYKFFYALAQRVQENEVKTAEIFVLLQQYFAVTNESIQRPVATNPGLIENFGREGFTVSVKPMIDADAGKISICVDTDDAADDYADVKLAICEIIKDSTAAGAVTQGTEVENIVLSNGQAFDFKFNLPAQIPVLLRLTLTLSENNQNLILTPEEIKAILMANIAEKYRVGKNFEPQTYFSILDAPWCSQVLLEWSDDDGANYYSTVYDADYDDKFTIDLADVELVET
jgi:hypothetical protein